MQRTNQPNLAWSILASTRWNCLRVRNAGSSWQLAQLQLATADGLYDVLRATTKDEGGKERTNVLRRITHSNSRAVQVLTERSWQGWQDLHEAIKEALIDGRLAMGIRYCSFAPSIRQTSSFVWLLVRVSRLPPPIPRPRSHPRTRPPC